MKTAHINKKACGIEVTSPASNAVHLAIAAADTFISACTGKTYRLEYLHHGETILSRFLRIDRIKYPVSVLGPGQRAVVWVQGCDLGCEGCIADYASAPEGGTTITLPDLADWALACEDIDGITISGGEPFAQAGELAEFIDIVRAKRDMGVMCFTGYTIEQLRSSADPGSLALLHRVDMLVDGPYIRSLHANLLWRGSSNQRIIHLTQRYRETLDKVLAEGDKSAGMEMFLDDAGVWFAGVPPMPDFVKRFQAGLGRKQ